MRKGEPGVTHANDVGGDDGDGVRTMAGAAAAAAAPAGAVGGEAAGLENLSSASIMRRLMSLHAHQNQSVVDSVLKRARRREGNAHCCICATDAVLAAAWPRAVICGAGGPWPCFGGATSATSFGQSGWTGLPPHAGSCGCGISSASERH